MDVAGNIMIRAVEHAVENGLIDICGVRMLSWGFKDFIAVYVSGEKGKPRLAATYSFFDLKGEVLLTSVDPWEFKKAEFKKAMAESKNKGGKPC